MTIDNRILIPLATPFLFLAFIRVIILAAGSTWWGHDQMAFAAVLASAFAGAASHINGDDGKLGKTRIPFTKGADE